MNYLNYYEALLPRLAERGLMALDNTLWSGRVLDESDDSDETKAIRELNDRLAADDRVVVRAADRAGRRDAGAEKGLVTAAQTG